VTRIFLSGHQVYKKLDGRGRHQGAEDLFLGAPAGFQASKPRHVTQVRIRKAGFKLVLLKKNSIPPIMPPKGFARKNQVQIQVKTKAPGWGLKKDELFTKVHGNLLKFTPVYYVQVTYEGFKNHLSH